MVGLACLVLLNLLLGSVHAQLATPGITISNVLADSGQLESINTVTSGGTGPYTVNFFNVTKGAIGWSIGYQQWLPTAPYPYGVTFQECATYSNNIYCTGGSQPGIGTNQKTYYAPILSNAILGSWTNTQNYPTVITSGSCVTYANSVLGINNIYCIAGSNGVVTNQNYYAAILSSGGLGTWTTTNNYPVLAYLFDCVMYSNSVTTINNIYCMDGYSGSGYDTYSYYAPILTNGALGAWQYGGAMGRAELAPTSCTIITNNIYCVSGTFIATAANVQIAPILSTGGLGAWAASANTYPEIGGASTSADCVSSGNIIFCKDGATSTPTESLAAYYAPVFSSGAVGAWKPTTNYPTYGYYGDCVAYNNMDYCIGNDNSVGSIAQQVYYAPITGQGIANTLNYTFQTHSKTNSNTFTWNVVVTDAEPVTANSIQNSFTVNTYPSTPTIAASINPTVAAGSSEVFTANWLTASEGTSSFTYNFNIANTATGTVLANMLVTNALVSNTFTWTVPSVDVGNAIYVNVIVTDSATTNVVFNSVNSAAISISSAYTAPTTPTLTLSNTLIDQGQSILLSANIVAGQGSAPYSYAYNVYAYNAQNSANELIANMLFTDNAYTSNSWFWTPNPNLYVGNSMFHANVAVADAHPTTVNSVPEYIGYNSMPAQPTITPSLATTYDNGQSITIASYETGGTSPYTYNFLVFNSITNVLIANMLTAAGGSNTFSFTANAAMIGNTYYANVLVTDAGSGSANSIKSGQITVNAALGQPTISPSIATAYDNGATITIATYETGGTSPYTYNFLVFNPITLIANMLIAAGGSNTFSFTANAAMIGNTYYANVLVTDAGSGSANSIKSGQITVNAALGQPTISPSIATAYDNGATITIATYETGGTSPYTYNFLVFNSITNVLIANMLTAAGGSNTFSFTANAAMIGNTYYANVLVTDAGSGSANSIKSGQITVNAALGQPTISPSIATAYDNGATITIATYETGGTSPYTYNFLVFNSITNVLIANMLTAAGGSNTFSFTANAAMIGNTYYANVLVTDAGSGSANSIKSGQITVNAALGQPTISPSIATAYDNGATITIATYETGGTSPYTYNFLVFNSITNVLIANMLTAAGGSNTFSFTANAAMIGNTYYANVLVTDGVGGTANSINSAAVKVNAVLTSTGFTASNTVVAAGQFETLTASVSGGTQSYTYNYLVYNSAGLVTNALYASNDITQNAFSFQVPAAWGNGPYTANLLVTDSATTPNSVSNALTITTGSSASTALTITASNGMSTNTITYGSNVVTINALVSGGIGPFTFAWMINGVNAVNTPIGTTGSSNIITLPGVGSFAYTVIATDTGAHSTLSPVTNTLVIMQNTTLSQSTISNHSITVGYYTVATINFNGIRAIHNQSTWSLYVNGQLYGTTNSAISWSEQAQPGTYTFVFKNPGDANYTNYSIGTSLYVQGITSGGSPGQAPTTQPVLPSQPSLSQVSFTSLPIYTSIATGQSYTSELGIRDSGIYAENITLGVGSNFSSIVSLSSNVLHLLPDQSASVGMLINATRGNGPGTYVIPIYIKTSGKGGAVNETIFITFVQYALSPSQPGILNTIHILNYTNSTSGQTTSGTIQISSPQNSSIVNATLVTNLPSSLTSSIANISTYGLPSNITIQNGSYLIRWGIAYLPANQSTYAYYSIRNSQNPVQLYKIQNIFSVPSQPSVPQLSSLFKIANVSVPIFYTNRINTVYMHALYTGSVPTTINLTATMSNGAQVYNSTRFVNLTPNQYLSEDFQVQGGALPGSALLTIYASSGGTSPFTYPIPILIAGANNTQTTQSTINAYESQSKQPYSEYIVVGIVAVIVIIVISIIAIKAGRRGGGFRRMRPEDKLYKSRKRIELEGIKEQIDAEK